MSLPPREYVFGPCQDGMHEACHGRLGNHVCVCDCGHEALRERVPA